jgi:hypothetical protein
LRTDDPTASGFLNALHRGSFYASTGLLFEELAASGGNVVVVASGATTIRFIGWGGRVLQESAGPRAEYAALGDEGYIRVEATGTRGKLPWPGQAWSQPFRLVAAPCGGGATPVKH